MKTLVTELDEIHPEAIELLKKNGHSVVTEADTFSKEKIEAAFIRTYTQADKAFLLQYPNLRYILRAGVGLDNIDLEECKKRNIRIFNAPGSNSLSVAEFVVALIIMLLRNASVQSANLKHGRWRVKEQMGKQVKGITLGLIGAGAIGRLVARLLSPFEVKLLGYDPYLDKETLAKSGIEKSELENILIKSDVISLHLPLTPETKNMISLKEMKTMKKGSYIINTSRGGIVNERDLIKAIKENVIAGAALDVYEEEPGVKKELLDLEEIIATPHIAGYTKEADYEMAVMPVKTFLQETDQKKK